MLGVTRRPSFVTSSLSHFSQTLLCATERSRCTRSFSAAAPAASAGPLTLKGPRVRFSASITEAGP